MGNIRIGPDSRTHDLGQFIGPDVEILYYTVAAALDKLPETHKAVPEFALWCHILYHCVPEGALPVSARMRRWTDEHLKPKPPSLKLSLEETVSRLARVRACGFCGISSVRKDDGKALSFCAGCKLVLYCSKSCQKQHWQGKGERSPHKAVCPILRRIDGIDKYTGQERGQREPFVDAFGKLEPAFTGEEIQVLGDWMSDVRRALGDDYLGLSHELNDHDEDGEVSRNEVRAVVGGETVRTERNGKKLGP
ncbi:hypothetical protein AURDEDRAFT_116576 [Auricularia subglabra TFB-10046 SS5]|nr:hypothetical protein AURDEDRAFT_116576 [Auricularia subglabra TFB-10046 SS5]